MNNHDDDRLVWELVGCAALRIQASCMWEVWMLRRICLMAGIVSTLMFMTPAVAGDYGVQKHRGSYGHVHAHRYYVRRGYVRPRGVGLFGCRHWSPVGVYWTCYFW